MSGAAEGIAGLALSAVSVAALFTTCIECFDIVVAGKNFSEDYEQLFTLFSLQRARFGLWGESVGLVPNPNDGCRLRYDKNLDRQDIRPGVERILKNIRSLLDEAGRVDERYGLKADTPQGSEVSDSRGMSIFKGSFERFKNRIRKHQKETSSWNITRWAIHDAKKFGDMINRLEKFVDGLESITKSLGLLEQQHARLREEIEIISDVESLRLLRDASSSHRSSQRDVSDTASRRLILVEDSNAEQRTYASSSVLPGTTESFVTAETKPSVGTDSLLSGGPHLPGAWPKSIKSDSKDQRHRAPPPKRQPRGAFKPSRSCEGCLKEHYKCVLNLADGSCGRCKQMERVCNVLREPEEGTYGTITEQMADLNPGFESEPGMDIPYLPQNQRLVSGLRAKASPRKPLSFAAGDAHYGTQLALIKQQDEHYWLNHSAKILGQANSGASSAKRMFIELRNIRAGKVPFVSAVPLEDSLDKVLASIEGPPETPYEGGVFWITIKLSETDPFGPPFMRFQTKIYHPNISPQGHICADFREKWNSFLSAGIFRGPVKDQTALWYRTKSSDIQWSLGALLTALCGLLASPDADDPLVPEIAQKYLEDYDGYCENAKRYTQKFATGQRPKEDELFFEEDLAKGTAVLPAVMLEPERDTDVISLQRSLRAKYDDEARSAGRISLHSGWETQADAIPSYMELSPKPASSAAHVDRPDEDRKRRTLGEVYESSFYQTITKMIDRVNYMLFMRITQIERHREWKAVGCTDIQTGFENPVSTTVLENAKGNVADGTAIQWDFTIAEIIREARDMYDSNPRLFKPVTDVHISYGLCKRAIEGHSLMSQAGLIRWKKMCSDHFAKLLSTTRAYVYQQPLSRFTYDVVLVYNVEGSNDDNFDWQFSRTIREVYLLDKAVNDGGTVIRHSAPGMNSASLLQNWLNHVLRAPTPALLENAGFLDFIRPDPHLFHIKNKIVL